MGNRLFIVTFLSLLWFFAMDWFSQWYPKFLENRVQSTFFKVTLVRIWWAILALVFWYTLQNELPYEFTLEHFVFAMFIFTLFRLLKSLTQR